MKMTINKTTEPGGLKGYTARWNDLVIEAEKLGLKLKGVAYHSSDFESYTKAQKRVDWLEGLVQAAEKTQAGMAAIKDAAEVAASKPKRVRSGGGPDARAGTRRPRAKKAAPEVLEG
jgi:hypothetical protein